MKGKSLQTTLYQAVHGSKLSVDELADAIGVGPSSLYRAVLEGDSGCKFDVQWLLPLMQATGDFRALDLLCHRANSLRVKMPRVKRWKRMDPEASHALLKVFTALIGLLLEYFDSPDSEKLEDLEAKIHEMVSDLLALRKALEGFDQMELMDE